MKPLFTGGHRAHLYNLHGLEELTMNDSSHYTLTDNAVLIAACVLSGMGALVFNAFPLFLSAIADQFSLNDAQLGLLGTDYLLGFAAITLFAPIWMSRFNWRLTGIAAMATVLIALSLQLFTSNLSIIYASMIAMGVGSGIVFTIGLSILARATDPERAFGIKLMFEMAFAGLLVYVMTSLIIVKFGFAGFVSGAALMYGFALLACTRLPANFMRHEATQFNASDEHSSDRKMPAWVAIFAMAIQFAAFSAVWAFMERIGVDNGLDTAQVGTILSLSILAGFGGALLAAVFGNRYGHIRPLIAGLTATILAVATLAYGKGLVEFVVGACIINGMLQFTLAYQMGLISHNDYNGKVAMMIPFILAFSGAMGPGIAGGIVEASGFVPVYAGFVIITLLTIATSFWVSKQEIGDA